MALMVGLCSAGMPKTSENLQFVMFDPCSRGTSCSLGCHDAQATSAVIHVRVPTPCPSFYLTGCFTSWLPNSCSSLCVAAALDLFPQAPEVTAAVHSGTKKRRKSRPHHILCNPLKCALCQWYRWLKS